MITLTPEEEAQIRRAAAMPPGRDGVQNLAAIRLLAELDAERAAHAETQKKLASERAMREVAEAFHDLVVKERDLARFEAFARGDERDAMRKERDALLADRKAWKEQVERNAYLGEQERAERAEAEAREAREEASRAWAVLTGRDWMEGRPSGSAVAAAELRMADLAAARAQLVVAVAAAHDTEKGQGR